MNDKEKLRQRPEHEEQKSIIQWANLMKNLNPVLEFLYAIPNGGERHGAVGAKLKAEGVKPGVPDLHLPIARGSHHSLYIELKAINQRSRKGGGLSKNQEKWIAALRDQGHRVDVCYGSREAIDVIEEYLKNE